MTPSLTRPAVLACGLAFVAGAWAQAPESLADLTLEQLSSIQVTSVGKRVQRLADVPGSVYVITQEDIRRSGAVNLPEVLRLAPNLQVARADAAQYAITARGFNSVLANKMLVLVDGRTVYSPLFSGVFWEALGALVEDIERIEVLSSASGTLYGANAVNGVINIVTRSAAETTGTLLKAGGGTAQATVAVRHGATTQAGLHWRAWGKRFDAHHSETATGAAIPDATRRYQAGFRMDGTQGMRQLTVQGELYDFEADQPGSRRLVRGAHLLARWTIDGGPGRSTQLQAYVDRTERDQPGLLRDALTTWDLEFQQTRRPAAGHELIWGAGYRLMRDHITSLAPAALQVVPPGRDLHLANLFVQDEVRLGRSMRATAGLKAEHNTYTGLEWLPNARLAWQPAPDQLLWAAVSRTVRTPARIERDMTTPQVTLGGTGFRSEVARVLEVGYRFQPATGTSYSVALFHHRFDRLRSVDALPAGEAFGNHYRGRLAGVEGWGRWRLADGWRAQAGFVHQRLRLAAEPGSPVVPGSEAQLGNDPRNRATFGLSRDFGPGMELDLFARHVGGLPAPAVPSYTAVDLRWGWRARPGLELSLLLRNLTDARHPEWGAGPARSESGRAVFFKATWRR